MVEKVTQTFTTKQKNILSAKSFEEQTTNGGTDWL